MFNPTKDIPSLAGKVILITGGTYIDRARMKTVANDSTGNTGLGKETVLQLAKHDPKEIFLAARTPSKAEAAIADIKKAVPKGNVSFIQLDLTSFASIKHAADEFNTRSDRLDILINNAGIMAVPWGKTNEGYELQFGTNHMGHALLTKLLLPTLLKTAEQPNSDVRIINVSSEGHQMAPGAGIIYEQAELEKWGTWRRYGQSKLANILHARELARRYPSITSTALHPGVIVTDLYASMNQTLVGKVFGVIASTATSAGLLYDVPKGAKNQLWAATASKETVRQSYYWKPVASKGSGSALAQKQDLAEKLWGWTEKELASKGY